MGQGGNCCAVCKIVGLLVIIGALNWGLVGLWDYNLVTALLGNIPKAVRITYILVGLAGLIKIVSCFKLCPCCKTGSCGTSK
jgi:uncharacterized membrane protein YuzA (DUF378 family)